MSDQITTFKEKCSILAEATIRFENVPEWSKFISENDIGLPEAIAISKQIDEPSEKQSQHYVNATWYDFLYALEKDKITWLDDDGNELPFDWELMHFENLDAVLGYFGTDVPTPE